MFEKNIYIKRRDKLKKRMKSGILLFMGNSNIPMNYKGNDYRFRQDSSFLYYFGIDRPNIAGVIDVDNNKEIIFGNEDTMDDMVGSGYRESLKSLCEKTGILELKPYGNLEDYVDKALSKKRDIHYLPQYRSDNAVKIEKLTGIKSYFVNKFSSSKLIKAIVEDRLKKSDVEIQEIKKAIKISKGMYEIAFKETVSGRYEREVLGLLEGYAISKGVWLSFPTIFTSKGSILHNYSHENLLKKGDMVVFDSGVESFEHYASDITRTIFVDKKATQLQKDVYNIVLEAQTNCIDMAKEGISFLNVHIKAALTIAEGLIDLGFLAGKADDVVESGAYALFFPHGIGHPMGLDVHDMEGLGEEYVGYDETVKRSNLFGLSSLRFAKELKSGYVMTIEPGVYFIEPLIKKWKGGNAFKDFINYDKIESMFDFGGIRIEDDVLITQDGCKVLSNNIPKQLKEIIE